jgi:hypothetical protein
MMVAATVSAAKPWIGRSWTIRWPIVLMIRQPPDAVPRPIAVAAAIDDPERHLPVVAGPAVVGGERHGDDAHRLLGVVAAVAERHVRRRRELGPPEESR